MQSKRSKYAVAFSVLVAALGYLVDVFDLVLFSVVRVSSLKSLGYEGKDLLEYGVLLLNMQMAGMLLGGVLWGIWGDKKGRLSVLFGSIILYSIANIANGFVESVEGYAFWRFVGGFGLAGELGAGITLVSEILPKNLRGYGTTVVATVGVFGAVLAGLVGQHLPWRTAYFIGGGLGLCLLLLRFSVFESGLFSSLSQEVSRGSLKLLISSRERLSKLIYCILSGVPIWFAIGILITFSPEIGSALNISEQPSAANAIMYAYIGLVGGDLVSGLLSQLIKSRRKVMFLFLGLTFIASLRYLTLNSANIDTFYLWCGILGFGVGYWAVFVTNAAEQFGTNLRATVATSVPNFVRGAVVLVTSLFKYLSDFYGPIVSAMLVACLTMSLAAYAIWRMKEAFHRDLNYVEI